MHELSGKWFDAGYILMERPARFARELDGRYRIKKKKWRVSQIVLAKQSVEYGYFLFLR